MPTFFVFKSDALDASIQAETLEDAKLLLLANKLARVVKKSPYISCQDFDEVRDAIRKEIHTAKITELHL